MGTIPQETLDALANEIDQLKNDLRYETGLQILYAGLLMDKFITARARKRGFSRSRVDIINLLVSNGGTMRPSDLSKESFRSKQAVTEIVDGLEADGLVERELVGEDRRTKRVIITRQGIQAARQVVPDTIEYKDIPVAGLSSEELQVLSGLLQRVRKHIEEDLARLQTDASPGKDASG